MSHAAPLAGQQSISVTVGDVGVPTVPSRFVGLTACDACPNSSSFLNDSDCEGDNSDGHPFVSIDAPLAGHQSVESFFNSVSLARKEREKVNKSEAKDNAMCTKNNSSVNVPKNRKRSPCGISCCARKYYEIKKDRKRPEKSKNEAQSEQK